jgi:hypothetical protein
MLLILRAACCLFVMMLCSPALAAVGAPTLKWKFGGSLGSWCETGWYSSPAVADLDGDGFPEVIGAAYSVFALDGRTGALKWRAKSGHDVTQPSASNVGRTWPGVVVTDLEGDGPLEIVTAHGGGWVGVYDATGHFKSGWPWQGAGSSELRSLAVADLDGDGVQEIAVGRAGSGSQNTWVLEPNGTVRSGWPQATSSAVGYAAGIYNNNLALADLERDGRREVIAPSDVQYICAYDADGAPRRANAMYGSAHAFWGLVPSYLNPAYELQGWGPLDATDPWRGNFASSPAVVADVDGDGQREVVVVGNIYDYSTNPYTDLYCAPYIFNADRSRFNTGGHDWRTPPTAAGALLSEDYSLIENVQPNPAVVDLDGDGKKEIIYPSYDGRMHAFWLDKTEHGAWPFSVYKASEGFYRFASEPVVVDLDGDGSPEVLFGSWTQIGSNAVGKLHILNAQGNVLREVTLPASQATSNWEGALAGPTLADVDKDGELEIVLNTAHAGIVVYDLPGTAGAKILWQTSRGNFGRTGEAPTVERSAMRHWTAY